MGEDTMDTHSVSMLVHSKFPSLVSTQQAKACARYLEKMGFHSLTDLRRSWSSIGAGVVLHLHKWTPSQPLTKHFLRSLHSILSLLGQDQNPHYARLQSLSISPELHRQGFPSGSRSPPRRASSQTRQSTLGTMLPATLPHAAGRNSDSPPVVSGSSSVADSALLTHLRNPLPSITLSRGRQALCPGHER